MRCKCLFIMLFTLLCRQATAAVFVVTSNADSGPGTLREALTKAAANGSAEKDFINFNLPGTTIVARTITINNALPYVSSNMVIDDSTQPGAKFGVSEAKVKIVNIDQQYPSIGYDLCVFKCDNVHDVIINGFYLASTNFYRNSVGYILVSNSSNIGVYHCLMESGIFTAENTQKITLQSSILGLFPDGYQCSTGSVDILNCNDITIGGDETQGNVIEGFVRLYNDKISTGWNYSIGSNKMGVDFTGTKTSMHMYSYKGRIQVIEGFVGHLPVVSTGKIYNNMLANYYSIGINVQGRGNVTITGNMLNTDKTGTANFWVDQTELPPRQPNGIVLDRVTSAIVGGPNPGDPNIIGNMFYGGIQEGSEKGVLISQNSIFCIYIDGQHGYDTQSDLDAAGVPKHPSVKMTKITPGLIVGTATPGAKIELFYDDISTCGCDPRHYFASTNADAQGNWTYAGNTPTQMIVASSIYNNNTSLFTQPEINLDHLKITPPDCGKNNGSIEGIEFYNAAGVTWINDKGVEISHNLDIKDLPPGNYKLKIGSGNCSRQSNWITVIDPNPKIDDSGIKTTMPVCNTNGSILGLQASVSTGEDLGFVWINKAGTKIGDKIDIDNLPPDEYTLVITGVKNHCQLIYGPIVLKKTTGPTIDDSKPIIINTNCGQTIGSIKNIIITGGTGTRHFTWKNEQQQEVATTQDLTGQPAGKYTLQVTDDSQCAPVFSKAIEILEINGITVTESPNPTTPASCGKANGAVIGVTATGGTKYEWRDTNGNLVGSSPDLKNVPAGAYQLTVSNAFCQKQSKVYQVAEQSGTVFPSTYSVNHIDACYGAANGALQINQDILIKAVRWVNAAGVDVAMHHGATGLPAGNYKLYLTDQNGCESYYNTYQVNQLPELKVTDNGQTGNEQCGLKSGYVSNVTVAGGLPPYTYTWLNANGVSIGTTSSISNLAEGSYTLNIADSRCGSINVNYQIQNITQDLAAPLVSDIQVCSPGDAILFVNNAGADVVYRLYDQANSASPLTEQTGGRFKVSAIANRSFFVSAVNGTCESPKTEVKVSVGLSPLSIANSFTPNGDGHNDYWKISNIESYPAAVVQVFNRNGQKLFESKGYSTPFNGTYNGKALPVGTYYYIINLNKNCNLLSGSLTILR
ncbi:gliding motility-associated C-terminal domain-containing protein [Mucilaginibacter sp. AW1-7]|uniref:gliding motility-associated C-terminal domain-containing protein n=1 Tax=Mucilaginibacter sp. AW1-7 TaxID=3349874 RepID=UPI003F7384A0